MEKYLVYYCEDSDRELKKAVNRVLRKLKISQDDEYLSIAHSVLLDVWKNFHKRPDNYDFDTYLRMCLENRFKSELTSQNRIKRKAEKDAISIEQSISDGLTLEDVIPNTSPGIEDVVFAETETLSPKVKRYLDSLTNREKRIAELIMSGKSGTEITMILGIPRKKFEEIMADMRSYERARILIS